jgi:alkylhydroperoxidase family enzyme
MFTWFVKRRLDAFQREWNYDLDYAREMLDAGGIEAVMPMWSLEKISAYRRDCPRDAYHAARIVAARAADCGPCLQLSVRMAEREGMAAQMITAVLTHDRAAMTDDVRLAYDFARAVLARDGWDQPARERIVERFGRRALIALSYGIALAGFYPAFKYAYGAAHACQRIAVGSSEVAPLAV